MAVCVNISADFKFAGWLGALPGRRPRHGLEVLIYKGFELTSPNRSGIMRSLDMPLRLCREIVRVLRLALCFFLGCLSFQQALAAVSRPIPANATKAVMTFVGNGLVVVDSRQLVLGPAVQIRDTHNRIVQPTHFAGEHKVRVLTDINGYIHRVWILTPAEIAAPDPKQ